MYAIAGEKYEDTYIKKLEYEGSLSTINYNFKVNYTQSSVCEKEYDDT